MRDQFGQDRSRVRGGPDEAEQARWRAAEDKDPQVIARRAEDAAHRAAGIRWHAAYAEAAAESARCVQTITGVSASAIAQRERVTISHAECKAWADMIAPDYTGM